MATIAGGGLHADRVRSKVAKQAQLGGAQGTGL